MNLTRNADEALRALVEARVRTNALYSLYKEARETEDSCWSIVNELVRADVELDPDQLNQTITELKGVIDKAGAQ